MLPGLFNNVFWLIFFFFATSFGILIFSFLFTESIKGILSRFKLTENFVGSSLLAAGTSLAEAINAITAGIYDRVSSKDELDGAKYSLDSLYNLTGAISIQLVFLSAVVLIKKWRLKPAIYTRREYREFKNSIFQNKTLLWTISTVEVAILTIGFIFPEKFKFFSIGSYNLIPFIFLIFWISYLVFTKKEKESENSLKNPNYTNIFQKYQNKPFLCLFVLIFISFAFLAFFNFSLVSKFEKVFHIPKNIGLGIILSLITSFPEFASFSFLLRSKCYKTACAGFLGSAAFNLTLPVLTQLIRGGWLFDPLSSDGGEQLSLAVWLFSVLLMNLFFYKGFHKVETHPYSWNHKKEKRVNLWGTLVILTYISVSLIIPIVLPGSAAKTT